MGIFDELQGLAAAAEKAAAEHPDQVKAALQKLENVIDEKTGGQHHDQIVQAGAKAEQFIDRQAGSSHSAGTDEASAS